MSSSDVRKLLDKARANRIGIEGYIRVLAFIRYKARSSEQIAEKFGINEGTVVKLMRFMRRLKLVHRESYARPTVHSRFTPFWRLGADGDVPLPGGERPTRVAPNPMLILLATVIEVMQEQPSTIADIAEELGVHPETAHRIILLMREHGLSRIRDWQRGQIGAPAGLHGYLGSSDAKRPGPADQVEARKRWRLTYIARKSHRALVAATAVEAIAA